MYTNTVLFRASGSELLPGGSASPPLPPGPVDPPPPGDGSQPERLKISLVGSRRAIENTIQTLHLLGYVERVQWSTPVPTKEPGELITMLERRLWLE